jgi:hypothetical protein
VKETPPHLLGGLDDETAPVPAPWWTDPQWRHEVVERAAHIRFPVGDLVAAYTCRTEPEAAHHHHQVFRDGALVAWDEGLPDHVDVHLAHQSEANRALLLGTGDGQQLASMTYLIVEGEERPVPPVDEALVRWGDELPRVPGVGEILIVQIVTGTPFGDLRTWFRIDGGPVVEAGVGHPGRDPDIVVQRRLRLALLERAGTIDVLDSLEGGGVHGDSGKLMMFLGGYDAPECRAARRTLASSADMGVAGLGAVLGSSAWEGVVGGSPDAGGIVIGAWPEETS